MTLKQVLLALAPAATFLAVGASAQARPVSSDSARLQGTWSMISGTADGVVMPPSYVGAMRRILNGNTLMVTMGPQIFFTATVELHSSENPRTIDYHMTGGPTSGAIQRGIYRFSGDTVFFCMAGAGAARPAEFASKSGDGRTLSSWVPVRP